METKIQTIQPGSFNGEDHWYPKALNATIHPMVSFFLNLSSERIINRYCHLHPMVNRKKLEEILTYKCKYFLWCGADLINSTSASGNRQMVVIENNSCPSGQKSMPLLDDNKEEGSYKLLVERTFQPYIKPRQGSPKREGKLAVIYDKNFMEASGYAKIIADVFKEDVLLVPFFYGNENNHILIEDRMVHVMNNGKKHPIRAAFRYLTQRPWTRLPLHSKTKILNPNIRQVGWYGVPHSYPRGDSMIFHALRPTIKRIL